MMVHQLELHTNNIVGHVILNVTIQDSGKCCSLFGLMYTDVRLGTNCMDHGNTRRLCLKGKGNDDNSGLNVYEMTTTNFINYL